MRQNDRNVVCQAFLMKLLASDLSLNVRSLQVLVSVTEKTIEMYSFAIFDVINKNTNQLIIQNRLASFFKILQVWTLRSKKALSFFSFRILSFRM